MKQMKWLLAVLLVLLLGGCASRERVEIHTAEELLQMAENGRAGNHYVLMADIDLEGRQWEPVKKFKGQLDGNGKTVSNVTICNSVDGNLGLFATLNGTVKNLHLENVTLTADGDTQYAGLLAGTNRGVIENCTVTGCITDDRAETEAYVGIFAGVNDGGKVRGGSNLLTATAGSPNPQDKVAGLSGRVALFLANGREAAVGVAGKTAPSAVDSSMRWQDTSGSIAYKPEAQQLQRQAVVDKMYQMGTVRWTTSEEISYTASNNTMSTHSNVFIPGRTYIGLPYSGCEGSYERFLSQMQETPDEQGRLVTVTGLEDGIKTKAGEKFGFIRTMGNDCYGSVVWALSAAVPAALEEGGIQPASAHLLVPNDYNTRNFGVLPVGGYQVIPSDETQYTDGIDARDTRTIIELNGGAAGMAQYYARATRGDFLLYISYTWKPETGTWKRTGNHGRMLAYDPMIVRRWDGTADLEESYVITHEQGDGLYDNRMADGQYETYRGYNLKQSSWRTDYKYTLSLLLTEEGYNAALRPGSGYGYVPITAGVYDRGDVQLHCKEVSRVTLPNQGWYEANFMLTSAKMTITDGQGNTVYEKKAMLPGTAIDEFQMVKLEELFPDAAEGLTAGQTYYETLQVENTGGKTCTVLDKVAFTG